MNACQNGNLEVVKYLVEVGHCQCFITDSSLNTPLHLAAQHDSLSVVQYLLEERKCDANPKNDMRNTPLLEASYASQLNVVKYLLENGYSCNPKAYGSNGYNCLHAACHKGHLDMIQYLIEVCQMDPRGSISNANYYSTTNSLHIVSQYGHISVVEYLIEKRNMNPNIPDENGNTPLHLPVIHNHIHVVTFLARSLKYGVHIIPQSLLDQVKDSEVRDYINESNKIIETSSSTNPLLYSLTRSGDLNTLKRQTKKALQSCEHVFGRRLIHVAAVFGHLDIIKIFIEQNVFKADLEDDYQVTPLHLAASTGSVDIFKYLVKECKCDPNCKVSNEQDIYSGGGTPLHFAAIHGHLSVVKHILESDYGIDADVETYIGTTPLQCAAMKGHLDILKFLTKKHNCNASHTDRLETTAMHLAARNDNLEIVRYLKEEMKCDPTVYKMRGKSIIHIATFKGSLDIIKYLILECGIDPNMQSTITSCLGQCRTLKLNI